MITFAVDKTQHTHFLAALRCSYSAMSMICLDKSAHAIFDLLTMRVRLPPRFYLTRLKGEME